MAFRIGWKAGIGCIHDAIGGSVEYGRTPVECIGRGVVTESVLTQCRGAGKLHTPCVLHFEDTFFSIFNIRPQSCCTGVYGRTASSHRPRLLSPNVLSLMDDTPTSIRRLLSNTTDADDWYQLIVEASGAMASINKFIKSVSVAGDPWH